MKWWSTTLEYNGLKLELYERPVLDPFHKNFYHCTAQADDGFFYDMSIALDEKTVLDIARI
jgi:hypothetical protein